MNDRHPTQKRTVTNGRTARLNKAQRGFSTVCCNENKKTSRVRGRYQKYQFAKAPNKEKKTEKITVRPAILKRETPGSRPMRTPLPPRATNNTVAYYYRKPKLIFVVTRKRIGGSNVEFHEGNPVEMTCAGLQREPGKEPFFTEDRVEELCLGFSEWQRSITSYPLK